MCQSPPSIVLSSRRYTPAPFRPPSTMLPPSPPVYIHPSNPSTFSNCGCAKFRGLGIVIEMGRTQHSGGRGISGRSLSALLPCFAPTFLPYALVVNDKEHKCSIYSHHLYKHSFLRYSDPREPEDTAGVDCPTRSGPLLGRSQTSNDERLHNGCVDGDAGCSNTVTAHRERRSLERR